MPNISKKFPEVRRHSKTANKLCKSQGGPQVAILFAQLMIESDSILLSSVVQNQFF